MSLSLLLLLGLTATAAAQRDIPSSVPDYVTKYAPIVYLDADEKNFPSDIGAQLTNTHPELNFTSVTPAETPLTLDNLSQLNSVANSSGGKNIYLTSNSDPSVFPPPAYLLGVEPDATTGVTKDAVSCAIVTVDHPANGTLDAFYFYFYAFNFGGEYFGLIVDLHIGDWEHNMIRFNASTGLPLAVYYSQHSAGEAYTYSATEKSGATRLRPTCYSGNGTHANYATPGSHDHTIPGLNLPLGPIEDHTGKGFMWDPTLSAYYYTYTPSSGQFAAYASDNSSAVPDAPVDWLAFVGRWGDQGYPESDPRQSCPFGISALCEWMGGPTGPEDKDLDRTNVCPDGKDCNVLPILTP